MREDNTSLSMSSFHSMEWKGFLERTILYPGVHVTWAVVVLLLVQRLQRWPGREAASVQGLLYSLVCHAWVARGSWAVSGRWPGAGAALVMLAISVPALGRRPDWTRVSLVRYWPGGVFELFKLLEVLISSPIFITASHLPPRIKCFMIKF